MCHGDVTVGVAESTVLAVAAYRTVPYRTADCRTSLTCTLTAASSPCIQPATQTASVEHSHQTTQINRPSTVELVHKNWHLTVNFSHTTKHLRSKQLTVDQNRTFLVSKRFVVTRGRATVQWTVTWVEHAHGHAVIDGQTRYHLTTVLTSSFIAISETRIVQQ